MDSLVKKAISDFNEGIDKMKSALNTLQKLAENSVGFKVKIINHGGDPYVASEITPEGAYGIVPCSNFFGYLELYGSMTVEDFSTLVMGYIDISNYDNY